MIRQLIISLILIFCLACQNKIDKSNSIFENFIRYYNDLDQCEKVKLFDTIYTLKKIKYKNKIISSSTIVKIKSYRQYLISYMLDNISNRNDLKKYDAWYGSSVGNHSYTNTFALVDSNKYLSYPGYAGSFPMNDPNYKFNNYIIDKLKEFDCDTNYIPLFGNVTD